MDQSVGDTAEVWCERPPAPVDPRPALQPGVQWSSRAKLPCKDIRSHVAADTPTRGPAPLHQPQQQKTVAQESAASLLSIWSLMAERAKKRNIYKRLTRQEDHEKQ